MKVKRFQLHEPPKVVRAQEGVKFASFTPVEQEQLEIKPTENPFSELNFVTPEIVPTKPTPAPEIQAPVAPPVQPQQPQVATQGNPNIRISKGSAEFNKHFDNVAKSHPEILGYKKFLAKTAEQESGFNSYVQNKAGAPCYGYFQMKASNIKQAGMTVESFRRSPEAQILAAYGLAKRFESGFSQKDRDLAAQKGYTKFGLLGGAWLGGNAGMRKVLNGTGNPTDKRWSQGRFGTSVKDRSNMFNFQQGGRIKVLPNVTIVGQKPHEYVPPKYDQSYYDSHKSTNFENTIRQGKEVLRGLNNTIGTALSGASLLFGGGWAATRLLGIGSGTIRQSLAKHVLTSNKADQVGDIASFAADPTLPKAAELGVGYLTGIDMDFSKTKRLLKEVGNQGINLYNSIK